MAASAFTCANAFARSAPVAAAAFLLVGCSGDGGQSQQPTDTPTSLTVDDINRIDLDRTETTDFSLNVPASISGARPIEQLDRDEPFLAMPISGPAHLRITETPGTTAERVLVEQDYDGRQLLVVHRTNGIALGGETIVRGPLDARMQYLVYLLPSGGEKRSATVTRIRPLNNDELVADRERLREADRPARGAPPVDPPSDEPPKPTQ